MTDQEILANAIEVAIARGWTASSIYDNTPGATSPSAHEVIADLMEYNYTTEEYEGLNSLKVSGLIFHHSFAFALWGNGPNCPYCGTAHWLQHPTPCPYGFTSIVSPPLWKWHLQQMVVAEDSIRYLGDHLPE